MKKLESKRFILVAFCLGVVSVMGLLALRLEMEAVAVTCATGLIAIVSYYIKKESDVPSCKPKDKEFFNL